MKNIIQFLLVVTLFWNFWTPGIKVATDFHSSSSANLANNIYPFTWKDTIVAGGLGEYTVNVLWAQPFHALFGILSLTNIPFEIVQKLLGLLCLFAGFFSIRKLLEFLGVGFWGKIVGTYLYLTNTFFILLFDGGQLPLALGYGVLPLIILYFLKTSIWFTFWLVILSFLDIRLLYIVGIILSVYLFYSLLFFRKNVKFKKIFVIFILSFAVLVGIHAYWILPVLLSKSPQLPQTYERVSQVDFLSFSSILHSLLLQQPHWYENVFGRVSQPEVWFVGIPFLVFSAIFLKRKDKTVGFWAILALVGIFLSKGSQEPLPQVYSWLFTNMPGFAIFRDPVKFYFLIALAFTILISLSVQTLSKYFKFLPILTVIYLIWLMRPVYLGQMTGVLSFPGYQKEYSQFENILKEDKNPSIIFWIPTKAPLGYSDMDYPSVDAVKIGTKRPFIVGSKGTYETLNFLREAPYMGEIFDVAGIGYIAYPLLDKRRDNMHPDNIRYYYVFADQLSKRPWLSKMDSPIPLFKTKFHQDKFFITPNLWWVIGSDNIYNETTTSAQLKLSKNSLIFADEYAGLGSKINQHPDAKIVLNNKTALDLAASFISQQNLIFPAKSLDFAPNKSGWWKREAADISRWRDFLQTKYAIDNQDFDLGGGWAIGEGNLNFKIQMANFKKGDMLLARVLESTRSGQLKFIQNGQEIGKIETKRLGNNIRWFEVGELNEGDQLEIQSSGNINVVNALAILDKKDWLEYQKKAESLQHRIAEFSDKNATSSASVIVTYKKINPTKYTVTVSGLTQPSFLVFSENYDNLWKINGQAPLPVYSLLNGFRIEKDGQYTVEFEAQKYVYSGLIISGLTTIALVLLLFPYIMTICSNLLSKLPHLSNHR